LHLSNITRFPFTGHITMKKQLFKIIAKANKIILPSFTRRQLDISIANKFQLAIIGWRAYVTLRALD